MNLPRHVRPPKRFDQKCKTATAHNIHFSRGYYAFLGGVRCPWRCDKVMQTVWWVRAVCGVWASAASSPCYHLYLSQFQAWLFRALLCWFLLEGTCGSSLVFLRNRTPASSTASCSGFQLNAVTAVLSYFYEAKTMYFVKIPEYTKWDRRRKRNWGCTPCDF